MLIHNDQLKSLLRFIMNKYNGVFSTGGSIKNKCEIKEGDEESNGIVQDPEDGTTDIQEIILNEVKIDENIMVTNSGYIYYIIKMYFLFDTGDDS